ncbi:MAG: o-succinylbenzoate synthase [Duncaniella sp.]|nr:o-succinylbenzoate synthase [Duncaniella sp.]
MLKAEWTRYRLDFKFEAITSRDRLRSKDTYYIRLSRPDAPLAQGLGEAGLFRGLSIDDRPGYEKKLAEVCADPERYIENPGLLREWPSIAMGLESARLDLEGGGRRILFDTPWSRGDSTLKINGLIWMGDYETMLGRLREKMSLGFSCIKVKIGGIDFGRELKLLSLLREATPGVELRLDANGAFSPAEALGKLEQLARYDIHSIEQPIRQGQWAEMARICRESPIAVALDEELIALTDREERQRMLEIVRPSYIILKPTLTGGFKASEEWIALGRETGAEWWATSALESNIGLNAISQWAASLRPTLPQGLGTGQLYHNNIPSPLRLERENLSYNPHQEWQIPELNWH